MKITGTLSKMETLSETPVRYQLTLGETQLAFSDLVGKSLKLSYSGNIYCCNCNKKTKKSYGQGYCYPCTIKLAECDMCILKPETCHYDKGTCREPKWGEDHCLKPHVVYLANSSGLKVGITRRTQVPFRWMDQGATEALPILEVNDRKTSGMIEVLLKAHVADKTDWRKMLKGNPEPIDLVEWKGKLLAEIKDQLAKYEHKVLNDVPIKFHYPVTKYPEKVSSLSFDKTAEISSKLMGIKGQYLIFEAGVLNVRSHTGYEITIEEVHG